MTYEDRLIWSKFTDRVSDYGKLIQQSYIAAGGDCNQHYELVVFSNKGRSYAIAFVSQSVANVVADLSHNKDTNTNYTNNDPSQIYLPLKHKKTK